MRPYNIIIPTIIIQLILFAGIAMLLGDSNFRHDVNTYIFFLKCIIVCCLVYLLLAVILSFLYKKIRKPIWIGFSIFTLLWLVTTFSYLELSNYRLNKRQEKIDKKITERMEAIQQAKQSQLLAFIQKQSFIKSYHWIDSIATYSIMLHNSTATYLLKNESGSGLIITQHFKPGQVIVDTASLINSSITIYAQFAPDLLPSYQEHIDSHHYKIFGPANNLMLHFNTGDKFPTANLYTLNDSNIVLSTYIDGSHLNHYHRVDFQSIIDSLEKRH
jgi:hypothetical protein